MDTKWIQVSLVVISSILTAQQANAEAAHHNLSIKSTIQQEKSALQTPKVKQVG